MGVNLHERETAHQPHHTTLHHSILHRTYNMSLNPYGYQPACGSTYMGFNRYADVSTYIHFNQHSFQGEFVSTYVGANLLICQPAWLSTRVTVKLLLCQPKRLSTYMGVRLFMRQHALLSTFLRVNLLVCQRAYRFQPAGVSTWVGVNPVMCRVIID